MLSLELEARVLQKNVSAENSWTGYMGTIQTDNTQNSFFILCIVSHAMYCNTCPKILLIMPEKRFIGPNLHMCECVCVRVYIKPYVNSKFKIACYRFLSGL